MATAVGGGIVFARILSMSQVGFIGVPLFALFFILFLWISFSFWMATFGFFKCLIHPPKATVSPVAAVPIDLPRTAILLPVYNEDAWSVFAGLAAMHKSIVRILNGRDVFDFFVLSDTNEPNKWLEEELAWGHTTNGMKSGPKVYYRRRQRNEGKKSGNIADFCRRWGSNYKYMIVLDADSVVAGETMLEMVRRMEEDPELGLLQVPPVPVNRGSLFARLQEFGSSVYGKVFTAGFGMWSHIDGNYWGHNAIIRTEPFIKHCGLPKLPGQAPFGGEILSHDFVEAAFLLRAGWKIQLADDLGGSYEECPATVIDFAKRDQRWCQGNLQHLYVMYSYNLHPLSRMHMIMGVMSYVASPLWLMFMLFGAVAAFISNHGDIPPHVRDMTTANAINLFVMSISLLLLPKLWGYLILLRQPARLAAHGGAVKAAGSVILETVVSVLVAPIMMVFHVTFVLFVLVGRQVQWTSQQREETSTTLNDAFISHGPHTIYGLIATLLVLVLIPNTLWWLSPVLLGLVASIPLSMILSSVAVGQALRSIGLLNIAEETGAPRILRDQQELLKAYKTLGKRKSQVDPFLQVIVDPAFNAMHRGMLKASRAEGMDTQEVQIEALQRVALYGGPERMSHADKMMLLSRESALVWLHKAAWSQWSMDSLSKIVRCI